ncbi:MAG: response regulator [Candidatus Acidiferrum sp.]
MHELKNTHAPLSRSTLLARRLSFSLASIAIYVLLDRAAVYLQIWPNISAWYPPVGITLALIVGLGVEAIPSLLIAGFLAGIVNYHESVTSLPFLLINPLVPTVYSAAGFSLRKWLRRDYRLHTVHEIFLLLGASLLASFVSSTIGTAILIWSALLHELWGTGKLSADPKIESASVDTPQSLRILVAEDNVVNQRVISRMLEKMGHRVSVAENGQLALKALQAEPFDLVFMDMQMPVLDGVRATRAIRASEAGSTRHVPIIALTANAFDEDRQLCLACGMDGFLPKPVSAATLREQINSHFTDGKQSQSTSFEKLT